VTAGVDARYLDGQGSPTPSACPTNRECKHEDESTISVEYIEEPDTEFPIHGKGIRRCQQLHLVSV
jgi:hypothetical protein